MKILTEPRVTLIAVTHLENDCMQIAPDWEPNWGLAEDCDMLVEFGGRECYQSFNNPAGKTTEDYVKTILDHGHLSVLEHASATFEFRQVSRSLTHELVRHRHLSFSQVSQRYVPETDASFIIPDAVKGDAFVEGVWAEAVMEAQRYYNVLLGRLEEKFAAHPDKTMGRKLARQAARSVMPNCTETKIVVTGNMRAWRWFLHMRGNPHADSEIRALAVAVCAQLKEVAPACFQDFRIEKAPDGKQQAVHDLPY